MARNASAALRLPARVVSEATGGEPTIGRALARRHGGPRRTEFRLKLDDLAAVLEILGAQMAPRARQAWLTRRSAHLGWRRPVELLVAGEFDRVRGAALAYAAGDPT